jgi:putative FmdB family regulatory protein
MPTYSYKCSHCNERTTRVRYMADQHLPERCPCGLGDLISVPDPTQGLVGRRRPARRNRESPPTAPSVAPPLTDAQVQAALGMGGSVIQRVHVDGSIEAPFNLAGGPWIMDDVHVKDAPAALTLGAGSLVVGQNMTYVDRDKGARKTERPRRGRGRRHDEGDGPNAAHG